MKPTERTATSDLDMMLLRAGWPVADSPRVQKIRTDQMYRTRQATSKKLHKVASFFAALSKWFEHHTDRPQHSFKLGNIELDEN